MAGIGASAGGLEAFSLMLAALPPRAGVAYVFVQHLDPTHESLLAEILSKATPMPVQTIRDGLAVRPDSIYVAPPNRHVAIRNGVLRLLPGARGHGPQMPIDHFLRSLAEDRGSRSIGIILSGTASDGTLGLRAIKAAGGLTFAQDEQSAKYAGMPRSAAGAGVVDFVLGPQDIAREMARVAAHAGAVRPAGKPARGSAGARDATELAQIFALLRAGFGVDFGQYKPTTIERRIARRMFLGRVEALGDYLRRLRSSRTELEALYHDLLINVTSFFREPDLFDALRRRVFPSLLRDRSIDAPVRVWVPGCSTGEEAYSMGISILEHLGHAVRNVPVQIFATDVSDTTIERARSGRYPESIALDVGPEHLRRYFTKADGGYQVSRAVRDLCVFARQDITRDPPLSRMDLISCRNLLIYLSPEAQKRVIPTLHYALVPRGVLVLGSAESIGGYADLFKLVDRKCRIYVRKEGAGRVAYDPGAGLPRAERRGAPPVPAQPSHAGAVQAEADRAVLAEYSPPGVVIDDQLNILQFRGQTGAYIEPASGAASFSLLRMARREISLEVRAAVHEARRKDRPVRREVRLQAGGRRRDTTLAVLPLRPAEPAGERHYLVLFEPPAKGSAAGRAPSGAPARPGRSAAGRAEDERVRRLEHDLAMSREYLQSIIDERESANEELRSALEEIQSSNEELQSTNEEMETAKEELQSTNEELTTVNEELQNRNLELVRSNSDLMNLLSSVSIPILMLDSDLRIRRFTPTAERVLNLIPTDVGRPLGDLRLALEMPRLEKVIGEVLETLETRETEVRDRDGRWFSIRIRPYRTIENKIDGVVVVVVDIDVAKRGFDDVRKARDLASAIVETVRDPLVVLDGKLRVQAANRAFYRSFRAAPGDTEGRSLLNLGKGQWNIPELRTALRKVLPDGRQFHDLEMDATFPHVGRRRLRLHARRLEEHGDGPDLILLSMVDRPAEPDAP